MTETRGLGSRYRLENVENTSRKKARTLVHRLRDSVLFRWRAWASSKQAAGDSLGAAFWRRNRANEGEAETPSVVRFGIVLNPL